MSLKNSLIIRNISLKHETQNLANKPAEYIRVSY